MIGLNRPQGINIKSKKELDLIREAGRMLKEVKDNLEERIGI